MSSTYRLLGPILRKIPANLAHNLTIGALQNGIVPKFKGKFPSSLAVNIGHLAFDHPLGLAAGFDKNAQAINALAKTGHAHMEVGAVTPKPQKGNEQPTIFRDPDNKAIINRMGFNNHGLKSLLQNLERYQGDIPIGVNIGKNKTSTDPVHDYQMLAQNLAGKVDWLTINVSSPNTPGLRDLQNIDQLKEIITAVKHEVHTVLIKNNPQTHKPTLIMVKIAPDLSDNAIVDLAHLFQQEKIDAVITTNTTLDRPIYLRSSFAKEQGGLSGKPLYDISLHVQDVMASELKGAIPIIATGGIDTIQKTWERIAHGATLVQLYTAMIWEGPHLSARIAQGLATMLQEKNYDSIQQVIGSYLSK